MCPSKDYPQNDVTVDMLLFHVTVFLIFGLYLEPVTPVTVSNGAKFSCENQTWLHDSVCLPQGYRKSHLPIKKMDVSLRLGKVQLLMVDSTTQSLTLKMLMSVTWNDPGWIIDPDVASKGSRITLDLGAADLIWTPDLWIANVLKFESLSLLNPLTGVSVNSTTKDVTLFNMVILEIYCPMEFDPFPFDEQVCQMYLESTNHLTDEMEFSSTYYTDPEISGLIGFHVEYIDMPEEHKVKSMWINKDFTYSRTGFRVRLSRHWASFVMKYYLPSCAMVIVLCLL